MGLLNKVYLFFSCEEPFWPKELDIIGVALSPGEYKENCNMYLSLYNTNHGVVALCAMLSGDFAEKSESMEDEALMLRVMTPLLALFPESCPSRPESFYRTAWQSDKFARGSYSALQCQSKLEDRVTLAQPHDEVVFFAGEACSLDYPSCVNGAAINGEQVAVKVLALLDGASNKET
jgi:monoamine oxidase